jgi:acetamidase/formamidase
MGLTEIRNICPVSLDIPAAKQEKLHNRWHPDIPVAGTIKNGETVKIECVSWPVYNTQGGASHLQRALLGGLDWGSDW